ncbi:MAG: LysM peptidoglycan-binding domain-containing protein, partial [Wenzhouxiangellaceae bacterium]
MTGLVSGSLVLVRGAPWLAGVLLCVAVLTGLVACGAAEPLPPEQRHTRSSAMAPIRAPQDYRVARGDTLYSIAFRYGMDWREVARWNRIAPPYTIRVGQSLHLRPAPVMRSAVTTTGRRSSQSPPGDVVGSVEGSEPAAAPQAAPAKP